MTEMGLVGVASFWFDSPGLFGFGLFLQHVFVKFDCLVLWFPVKP